MKEDRKRLKVHIVKTLYVDPDLLEKIRQYVYSSTFPYGVVASEVAKAFGIYISTARRYLDALVYLRKVKKERIGVAYFYSKLQ